ncbi:metallo-beta-lactamase superfamily protein [Trichomonas vaginalis G3]|uniref:Metallo-beta-lactamase superfamily protein n=1 Tax=Trichomonas vaginalis (strain ATCC PRA-98 / G3) TaxID=412133 RepID=A2FNK4_TRIV3|nr:sulfur dioxygenase protein [Trichomonas vaginalis G3]EAX93504.1 metallo-beta-lactamase superfamily protein [Trichomonas vaginalis G3]KAI5511577.1 sulfur dioxygenase protein [Trichomonas vaginalis G3]|eukprot:XP_001306434.1 metallo-beta-lactamase superfamily protein [Trichomonas vaginalis G3]
MRTNCYLMNLNNTCLVIDPGAASKSVDKWLKNNCQHGNISIFLTHGHFDHISGVKPIVSQYPNTEVYVSSKDEKHLFSTRWNLGCWVLKLTTLKSIKDKLHYVEKNDTIQFGDELFYIHTLPGHTPGGLGLYSQKHNLIFTGDTLFKSARGSTSFIGGNYTDMMQSLYDLFTYIPGNATVYPGHYATTTIADEMKRYEIIRQSRSVTRKEEL